MKKPIKKEEKKNPDFPECFSFTLLLTHLTLSTLYSGKF